MTNKKTYHAPVMEIELLTAEDVIVTSGSALEVLGGGIETHMVATDWTTVDVDTENTARR